MGSAKRRVLMVMEPLIGGTLRHLEGLVQGLDPERFELTLAVSFRRDETVRARAAGWPVERLVEVRMEREPRPLRDTAALVRLRKLIKRGRFDVIHTHSSKGGFLGRLAARLAGFGGRVVHTPHIFPFEHGWHPTVCAFYAMLERRALAWTDVIVALTAYQKLRAMQALGAAADRVQVVPNGVDAERFRPMGAAPAREMLAIDPGAFVVAFVGRPVVQKGMDVLVRALTGRREVTVLHAGGMTRPEGVAPGVDWRGLGVLEDIRPVYAAADAVAVPSRFEGMPYVVLEAMSMGRPVVASALPGLDELVENRQTGLLVMPEDAAALGRALERLREQPRLAARLGAAAREAALARRLRSQIEATERIYAGEA
jgi:glycosyltransferase involved in cell wall biosynthesis